MCKTARSINAGLPSSRLTITVNQIGCSIFSLRSRCSYFGAFSQPLGIRVRYSAATEKLLDHFHELSRHHRKQARQDAQQCELTELEATQDNIRCDDEQSVAPQEFEINARGHFDFLGPFLRSR